MGAEDRKLTLTEEGATGTSETVNKEGDRVAADVAGNSEESLRNRGTRPRVGHPHLAFVAEKEEKGDHSQWRNRDSKLRRDTTQASAAAGVDAAISARVANECDRVSGHELSEEERKLHADLARYAEVKELHLRQSAEVLEPFMGNNVAKASLRTRWVLTWEMMDAKKCVKARLAAKGYADPGIEEGTVDTSG